MERSQHSEIMDRCTLPESVLERIHRELTWTNLVLGNTQAVLNRIRRNSKPVRRVLDIGCGRGGFLLSLRQRLNVDVIGVDLCCPLRDDLPFPIIGADAVRDQLPEADVAVCMLVAHHLPERDVAALIQNTGRSCRRLIMLDLVRSRVALALFRTFVAPFLGHVNAVDGIRSICRAYTKAEMSAIVVAALVGTDSVLTHSVAAMNVRQIVDITY